MKTSTLLRATLLALLIASLPLATAEIFAQESVNQVELEEHDDGFDIGWLGLLGLLGLIPRKPVVERTTTRRA